MVFAILIGLILIIAYNSATQKKLKKLSEELDRVKKDLEILRHQSGSISKTEDIPSGIANEIHRTVSEESPEKPELEIVKTVPKPDFQHSASQYESGLMAKAFDFLKQNILSVLGITTLVIGIGYFVKYAIDKNWINENLRVLLGVIAGFAIIGLGFFLKKNYKVFSSILTGGGIAVLYFTITIAFREYHLFSENLAFMMVCAITLLAIALSYYLRNEVLVVLAFTGGFGAPLMISTGKSNFDFLFIYLLILNVGMLLVYALRNYRSLVAISFIITTIYLVFRIAFFPIDAHTVYYAYGFVLLYFSAILIHTFRGKTLEITDHSFLVILNIVYAGIILYVFFALKWASNFWVPLSFSVINSGFAFSEYRKRNWSFDFSVFLVLAIAMFTLAFAVYFEADSLVILLSAESIVFLYLWLVQKNNLFFKTFIVTYGFSFFTLLYTLVNAQFFGKTELFNNTGFITGIFFVLFSAVGCFLAGFSKLKFKESFSIGKLFFVFAAGVLYGILFFEFAEFFHSYKVLYLSLFTLYYIFALFILVQKIFSKNELKELFYAVILLLSFCIPFAVSFDGFSGSNTVSVSVYLRSLSYLVPFGIILWMMFKDFRMQSLPKVLIWLGLFGVVLMVSKELNTVYDLIQKNPLKSRYTILYLPVIWTILGVTFIYYGMKNNTAEFRNAGFILIGLMILKLYVIDIWKMNQVSRIIAFILLGILLLVSSFMFQKLKKMISAIIEKNED